MSNDFLLRKIRNILFDHLKNVAKDKKNFFKFNDYQCFYIHYSFQIALMTLTNYWENMFLAKEHFCVCEIELRILFSKYLY